jgi:hypothetical protein
VIHSKKILLFESETDRFNRKKLHAMKRVLPILLILALHLPLWPQCADPANVYTFTYSGRTYEVIRQKMNWQDAAACAVERGGYLVEINDAAEQAAVYDAIINGAGVSPTYTTVSNGGGIAYVWIGATDQQTEGTWLWDGNNTNTGAHFWSGQGANGTGNGAAVGGAYTNWGGTSTGTPKEPDNYGNGQHHAAIGLSGWPSGTTMLGIAGEWNDIIGTSLVYFVVEKDSTSIGLNQIPDAGDIRCFPNPTNDILNLSITCDLVEIYTTCGKLVSRFENTRAIPLGELERNVYIVRILHNNMVSTQKVVVF